MYVSLHEVAVVHGGGDADVSDGTASCCELPLALGAPCGPPPWRSPCCRRSGCGRGGRARVREIYSFRQCVSACFVCLSVCVSIFVFVLVRACSRVLVRDRSPHGRCGDGTWRTPRRGWSQPTAGSRVTRRAAHSAVLHGVAPRCVGHTTLACTPVGVCALHRPSRVGTQVERRSERRVRAARY